MNSDPVVIVAAIGTIGSVLVAVISMIQAIITTRKAEGEKAKDKDKTQPVKVDYKELYEAMEIERDNIKRENVRLRKIIVAKDIWADKLTRQLRRHANHINPADYEAPNGGHDEDE